MNIRKNSLKTEGQNLAMSEMEINTLNTHPQKRVRLRVKTK
jgi:hypothetical protein